MQADVAALRDQQGTAYTYATALRADMEKKLGCLAAWGSSLEVGLGVHSVTFWIY